MRNKENGKKKINDETLYQIIDRLVWTIVHREYSLQKRHAAAIELEEILHPGIKNKKDKENV